MAEMSKPGQAPHPLLPVTGSSWPGVAYGCTSRRGGVSTEPWGALNLGLHVGDDPRAVAENRRRLSVGLPSEPFWLDQVHGVDVVEVIDTGYIRQALSVDGVLSETSPPAAQAAAAPRADAAITTRPGVVLAIMTADCIPVVLADTEGRALGVAHAGWRGLAAGVLENTLAVLRARHPEARAWRAWVGPCIGQAAFEVGDEVRHAFADTDPAAVGYFVAGKNQGKWQADLSGLACHRLATLGVYGIESSGLCTHDRADLFHSYRRSSQCGRMATLAWLQTQ